MDATPVRLKPDTTSPSRCATTALEKNGRYTSPAKAGHYVSLHAARLRRSRQPGIAYEALREAQHARSQYRILTRLKIAAATPISESECMGAPIRHETADRSRRSRG